MAAIGQLLKYLTVINPQTSSTRLAFYNFLNHFYRAEQLFTAQVLNTFISHALEYPHWQQNKSAFGKELQQLIENFFENVSGRSGVSTALVEEFKEVIWPQNLQIVDLDSALDFSEAVYNTMNIEYSKGEKFRLIADGLKKIHAVILFPHGQVRVRTFDRKMAIRRGILEPLRLDYSLAYDSTLRLSEAVAHKIELAPYTSAQFEIIEGQVVGSAVRGYLFQKFQDYRGGQLEEHSKLFYSIKRQEQFFVDRQTDGYYQGLVDSLERISNLVKLDHPEGRNEAPGLILRVESALEQVFIGDKLLSLLVRDLQSLCQTQQNKKQNPIQASV